MSISIHESMWVTTKWRVHSRNWESVCIWVWYSRALRVQVNSLWRYIEKIHIWIYRKQESMPNNSGVQGWNCLRVMKNRERDERKEPMSIPLQLPPWCTQIIIRMTRKNHHHDCKKSPGRFFVIIRIMYFPHSCHNTTWVVWWYIHDIIYAYILTKTTTRNKQQLKKSTADERTRLHTILCWHAAGYLVFFYSLCDHGAYAVWYTQDTTWKNHINTALII